MRGQEPVVVQLDPKCLHSALKEFFEPLRTNNPRADFFAVYRKESDEFDREYTRKYDDDLNTSLIFAGLFSAVSSAFIIDVQSKLEPDPNDMTAAYMQILIHTVNGSLFPDANTSATSWAGPPSEIVAVQFLLYASLATSLFASFLAMLGKQWINRYLRNHGGSAADKSRDRQKKLDGLEGWHFHLVIESLPVMLQLALLLLGCALSRYLWTISPTVSGLILGFTLLGVISYIFFTLAAAFSYSCPYQTPPSLLVRTCIRFIAQSHSAFARSLRSVMKPLFGAYSLSVRNLRWIFRPLRTATRIIVCGFGHATTPPQGPPKISFAVVTAPVRIFEDVRIDWGGWKEDTRCIAWVLHSTTDSDVIYSTVRFAADMIWYPETASALSPHTLADLFFDCLLDGRAIPDKLEDASSIGMALASVLSIQLSTEHEGKDLKELCKRIDSDIEWVPPFESMFGLVVAVLKLVAQTPSPVPSGQFLQLWTFQSIPEHLPTTCKLWLSRVMLQTIWRWRRVQGPTTVIHFPTLDSVCKRLMADGDQSLVILKTNCVLIMAISLGLTVDMRDLYPPVDKDALETVIDLLHQRLRMTIREGTDETFMFRWILSALGHFDPFQVPTIRELCFLWISDILNSRYPAGERCWMAGKVVELVWKQVKPMILETETFYGVKATWVPPLLAFLQLSEKLYSTERRSAALALQILSASQGYGDFGPTMLPILTPTLLSTHPLQSRRSALNVFHRFIPGWFSQMEGVSNKDRGRFLLAVSDPFQYSSDTPPQDEQHAVTNKYEPMKAAIVLIEFASSGLWRDHLRRLNFTSCEEVASTEEGKETIFRSVLGLAGGSWPQFLCTPAKIIAAITRLEELQCPNIAEVVFMWAWTFGIVDAVDHDAWKLIGHKTLGFYHTHGTRRLKNLSRHIMDRNVPRYFLRIRSWGPSCRVEGVRLPVRIAEAMRWMTSEEEDFNDLPLAQACQLRRLYRLFGCDATTWEGVVAVEKAEEVTGD